MSWADRPDGGDDAGGDPDDETGRSRLAPDDVAASRDDWSLLAALTNPAMVGVVLLSASYLAVLGHVTDVVGGVDLLLLETVGVLLVATLVAAYLNTRAALVATLGLLAAGLTGYYLSIPESQRAVVDVGTFLVDFTALLTGLSVLRLVNAQIWALAVLPAPLFGAWVLALRGEFARSSLVGGLVLGFFVLTGDAGIPLTLLGVVGAALSVGLGELEPRQALDAQWDTLVVVLAAMIVLGASLSVVPGGAAQPLFFGDGTPTLEANLVDNSERVGILGSIRLSPEVRFTIESERVSYWRVGSYDRYTGSGWVRTGNAEMYQGGRLSGTPGPSIMVEQTVTAETPLNALPAAWKPVELSGEIAAATQVTDEGGIRAITALQEGESYTVVSAIPRHNPETLRSAGRDYPDAIEQRYLQLPQSTPDRVGQKTEEIAEAANASNPYETAVAIERYLEANKRYSLEVEKPEGNIADAFLFEMTSGYCTYFATTMVAMLRTQGIPARFVTGYTPGERVAEDRWVVRGLDAHAWVEVYFPDVGWVAFDPTPGGPREAVEQQRISQARESGAEGVDTGETGPEEWTPSPTPTPTPDESTVNGTNESSPGIQGRGLTDSSGLIAGGGNAEGTIATVGTLTGTDAGTGGFSMPSREALGYGAAVLFGVVAAARRFGVDRWLYRFLWLRYQPRGEPVADVERAYRRMEALLASQHRPRRPGETPGDYVEALVGVDRRAARVVDVYERAHYRGEVSEAAADRAVRLVDGMVAETTPVLGRLRRALGRAAG